MLSCKEVRDLLSAYYDGELGVAASKQIEEHLESCFECRKELEDIKMISSEIKSLEFPIADEAFAASLSAALANQTQKAKPPVSIWHKIRPYAAAAACFVVAAGIYTAYNRGYVEPDNSAEPVKYSVEESTPAQTGTENENVMTLSADVPSPTPEDKTEYKEKSINKSDKKTEDFRAVAAEHIESGKEAVVSVDASPSATPAPVIENSPVAASENVTPADAPVIEDVSLTIEPEATTAPAPDYNTTGGSEASTSAGGSVEATPAPISGGGGSGGGSSSAALGSGITVRFMLGNAEQKDFVQSVLSSYGNVSEGAGYMRVRVLAANFDAAVATLRSMGALTETDVSGESGAYGFIEIEYKNTAE